MHRDLDDIDEAYRSAVVDGTAEAIDRYLAIGPEVVDHVHSLKTGRHQPGPMEGSGRVRAEQAHTLLQRVAARYPAEFLAAFDAADWSEDDDIVAAWAAIPDAEASRRVAWTLRRARSRFARVSAAGGLRMHADREAIDALRAALSDPETTVVNQAIGSLGAVAGPDAIEALQPFVAGQSRLLADAARSAIGEIQRRTS